MNYSIWITNYLVKSIGRITVAIYRDGNTINDLLNGDILPSEIIILNNDNHFLLEVGNYKKSLNKADGKMEANSIELSFLDRFNYSGTVNGTPVSEDLDASNKTLLSHIFDDLTAKYQIQVAVVDTDYVATDWIFVGDIDPKTFSDDDGILHESQTINERKIASKKITCYALVGDLKEKTVADFNDQVEEADMVGSYRFFAGFGAANEDKILYTNSSSAFDILAVDKSIFDLSGKGYVWDRYIQIASHGIYDYAAEALYGTTFPLGKWGMSLLSVFKVISRICKFAPFVDDDFIPAFAPIRNLYVSADSKYDKLGGGTSYGKFDIHLYYNYVFGQSPANTLTFDSPISFKQDTSLSEVLKSFAVDWGCYVWPTIDDDGRPGYKVIRRDYNFGNVPQHWKESGGVLSDKEEPREAGKAGVIVKNKASEDGIKVWSNRITNGEFITVETTLRAGLFGSAEASTVVFNPTRLTHNNNLKFSEQFKIFYRYDSSEESQINKESWIIGANYYSLNDDTGFNQAYPDSLTNIDSYFRPDIGSGSGSATFDGFYRLAGITEWFSLSQTNLKYRYNSVFAAAQFYAKELVGYPSVITRRHSGIIGDDGKVNSIQPGIRDSWYSNGAIRDFRVIETTQDFRTEETECKYIEIVNYEANNDLPFEVLKKGSGSSGGGTNGSSGVGIVGDTPDTTIINNSPVIVARAVALTKGDLHTYTEDSLQLVVLDPDTTKKWFMVSIICWR